MSNVPPPPDSNGNPLVGLAVAVIYAVLYVLDGVRTLVAWLTITVPSMIVRMLQYSLTISLGFPALLTISIASLVGVTFVVRYRYLARYTQLKETALPPPSPPSFTTELLPLTTPGIGDRRNRSAAFHNYLDDFLAAIRIFGYLEKPVFHELSRHLQTRRLAAGDSIEIGGGDFWCVVEGKVQVFAPSEDGVQHNAHGASTPVDTSEAFNGYHLLNEVSTGGTLSSLFSILQLFTEDIKLSWTPPNEIDPEDDHADENDTLPDADTTMRGTDMSDHEAPDDDGDLDFDSSQLQMKRKSRQDSDVSQMADEMGKRVTSPPPSGSPRSSRPSRHIRSLSAGSPSAIEDPTASPPTATVSEVSTSVPGTTTASPILHPEAISPVSGPSSDLSRSRMVSSHSREPSHRHPRADTFGKPDLLSRKGSTPGSQRSRRGKYPHQSGAPSALMHGTIARATVDTTLAVIPSHAFRKLTRKFPKASGTVVQVVLERFSRVTFMTAHKFLGLTREILRSESSLNALVSHPLPREFYTGGGLQSLRARFDPDPDSASSKQRQRSPNRDKTSTFPRVMTKDYFNYVPASPTVKAPSLPSFTPVKARTPAAVTESPSQASDALPKIDTEFYGGSHSGHVTGVPESADVGWSPDTARRHNTKFVRQTSAMRKQVGAGDLAMSRYDPDENGGAYYRKSMQTPGLPRQDTWRGRLSGSTTDFQGNGVSFDSTNIGIEQELEIRDAVMVCIAKSIGLIQPPELTMDNLQMSSLAASVAATSPSPPSSPFFPPGSAASRRERAKSPFGNVLDMMNASSGTDNMVSGMLREAVMATAQAEDNASNMSTSIHESGFGGQDINRNLLRDLEGCVEILFFKKGSTLVKAGERSAGIYYVIDGFLDVMLLQTSSDATNKPHDHSSSNPFDTKSPPRSTSTNLNGRPFEAAFGLEGGHKSSTQSEHGNDELLYTVKPGGLAGYLASLCSTDSYVNIKAKTDCYVGYLPTKDLERILERRPIVLLTLAKRLLSLLSPLVLHIDAGLDWMQLSAGQVLYEKGDRSSDIYIVINGRLRSLDQQDNTVRTVREYGQSDSIGELDVITAVPRSDTVHAIRDSELVRIPAALFDAISVKHPATTVQFMRLIAGRVKKAMGEQSIRSLDGGSERIVSDVNLKTVCILGTNRNVPVTHFAGKLKTSLEDVGATTSYLDQGTVMRHLGRHAFARIGQLKIAGWLADQEQHYRTVLYVADTPPSSQWTLTCIRQADLVLILAMGDDPVIGEYEKLLLATKTTARKELILLHDERSVAPGSTRPWLRNRPWLHAHHHVELPGIVTTHRANPAIHDPAAIAAFKHLREQVETRIKKYRGLRPLRPRRPPHMSDFARIARRLCGKQIGVVLGGGGGRGISHIGMLQALEESGIPVDAISGCSIGAFVGGLYARGTDLLETTGRTKQFSGRMGSMLRILSDVTYPFVAYTTGHEFNRGIYKAFYNTHIEDFWLPFFANSTNITHSRMEIHRAGYAWRYVRASMTLAGLLPPLSDNGNLLVDGGYMDNTPIGPLRANGIRDIFVVDVGSIDDTSPRNYGDSVSGWWIFLNKFNPFYKRNVLSMTEVSSRLVYVSSVKVLDDVKKDPHCLYLAMPVQQFETLGGFKKFSEVLAVGLQAGRDALKTWKDEGRLPTGLEDEKKGAATVQRGSRLRRMSI